MPWSEETARKVLTQRLEELETLSRDSRSDREPVTLDQQSVGRLSRMDAMQQQAMAQATERQRLIDLQKIHAALKRVDEGEFGYCENCGEEIAEERLKIDPAVAMCVKCARGN